MAQSEFVDLYELLNVPTEAAIPDIRKRISELYIEAQNNLDHRNAQRRLRYQQFYEIYLPQARHLLLDAARRAEYDRYLIAFRSGVPLAEVAPRQVAPAPAAVSDIPEMAEVEEQIDPEVLAAQREQLWNRWKSALDSGEGEAPAANGAPGANAVTAPHVSAAQTAPAAAAPAAAAPRSAGGTQTARGRAAEPSTYLIGPRKASAAAGNGGAAAAEEAEKQQKAEFDRHRQSQRAEMMAGLAQTIALYWTFGAGIVSMLVLCLLLFIIDNVLANAGKYPVLSLSRPAFTGLGFALCVVVAVAAAFIGGAKGRARVEVELGKLSFEELQRRSR